MLFPPKFAINVGDYDFSIPTVEGCLKDIAGAFYTAQNAIRVYEWLHSTETAPLLLEAKVAGIDGTVGQYQLGTDGVTAYPERWYPGQLLAVEQHVLAVPAINDTINRNMERAKNIAEGALGPYRETIKNLMQKLDVIYAFSASAMYFQSEIPNRTMISSIVVLDVLFTCVITQRKKQVYKGGEKQTANPKLYNKLDLDKVIGRMHLAEAEQFFPNPVHQAATDQLVDDSFYRQCAMAWSQCTNSAIPIAYFESETKVFHWAVQLLTDVSSRVADFRTAPKMTAVTSPLSVVK